MSAYAKLRRKRQLFVDAYVRTGVGRTAAIESGYSGKHPDSAAHKILANPEVKAAITERTEEAIAQAGLRQVRILEEIACMALASNEALRGADGNYLAFKDIPAGHLRASESIEFNPDGSVKSIRLAKRAGLDMAARYLKLFTEVHEHTGKDGGPIETKETVEISDLEKARRIAFLLNQGIRASRAPSILDDEPLSGDEPDV